MTETALALAHRLVVQAVDAVRAAAVPGAATDELMSVLSLCEGVVRQMDRVTVDTVAGLERRGAFAERGYRSAAGALGDLLGWGRFEARRRVVAAEQVTARVGLDGAVLPARMPATGAVFTAGAASLRHVEAGARVRVGGPPVAAAVGRGGGAVGREDRLVHAGGAAELG